MKEGNAARQNSKKQQFWFLSFPAGSCAMCFFVVAHMEGATNATAVKQRVLKVVGKDLQTALLAVMAVSGWVPPVAPRSVTR